MKKRVIALLSVVLLAATVISIFPSAAAEKTARLDGIKEYHCYTAVGDSISGGMRKDEAHQSLYFSRCHGSYPSLVAEAVGFGEDLKDDLSVYETVQSWNEDGDYYPFLTGCVRTNEILHMLTTDEEYDYNGEDPYVTGIYSGIIARVEYLRNREGKKLPAVEVRPKQTNYLNCFYKDGETDFALNKRLAESDLVTLGVGFNDFGWAPIYLSGLTDDWDVNRGSTAVMLKAVAGISQLLADGYRTYEENYPKILEKILEISKDADIILVGYYNAYENVGVFSVNAGEAYGLGDLVGKYVNKANQFLQKLADQYPNVYFADMSGVSKDDYEGNKFQDALQSSLTGDGVDGFIEAISTDTHPNWYGYRYMADQVVGVLQHIGEDRLSSPQNGKVRLVSGGRDGGYVTFRRIGLGWTAATEEGCLGCGGKASIWKYDGAYLYTTRLETVKKTVLGRFSITSLQQVTYYLTVGTDGKPTVTTMKTRTELYGEPKIVLYDE